MSTDSKIRLALPSKGRMESETIEFLDACGLRVSKANPRQYSASIPTIPRLHVLFQRAGDIPRSVAAGDMDLGITGYDTVVETLEGDLSDIVIIHDTLGFGDCALVVAVPEDWQDLTTMQDLADHARQIEGLRVATKHTNTVEHYFQQHGLSDDVRIITADGALEAAPAVGYADFIADLTSTGATLRDNRLRALEDGTILESEAVLIGNRDALTNQDGVLMVTRQLLEYIEADLRARGQYLVFANMRGNSRDEVAQRVFSQPGLGGLQGPTISPVVHRSGESGWWAINIVVSDTRLYEAIQQIRAIDGSGVIVTPATYIFEERPARYQQLLADLGDITEVPS